MNRPEERRRALLARQGRHAWDYRTTDIPIGRYDTGFAPFAGEDTGFTFLLEVERPTGGAPVSNTGLSSDIVLMSDGANKYNSMAGFHIYSGRYPYIICGWMGNGGYAYNGNCYLPGTNRCVWWHNPGTSSAAVTVNGLITVWSRQASYQSNPRTIVLNSFSPFKLKEFACYKRALTGEERSAYLTDGKMP